MENQRKEGAIPKHPAWLENDEAKAASYVSNLDYQNELALAARNAPSAKVRLIAVKKLADQPALTSIAVTDANLLNREQAFLRLTDLELIK